MSIRSLRKVLAAVAIGAFALTACGTDDPDDAPTGASESPDDEPGDDGGSEVPDGPTIAVASFNFPESEILGEIYAQALEDADYPVERSLNLGARELIYPELLEGNLDLLPEYLGSALVVWFEQDPPADVDSGVDALTEAFEPEGVSVLTPSPAENNQAFVVTQEFADEHDLTSLADLEGVGDITFSGPPECEDRGTCYQGLVDVYGLSNVTFESNQEAATRLSNLDSGANEMILLFSTDAPLAGDTYVVLEDTEGMLPPENITPVLRTEVVEAYGDELTTLIDDVTAAITTETLQQMNADASEGLAPADIASDWLAENP